MNLLWSDYLVFLLFFLVIIAGIWGRRYPHWREPWQQVLTNRLGIMALVLLVFFVAIGLLDSIHLSGGRSVLDIILSPWDHQSEETYSAPFSNHLYTRSMVELPDGKQVRGYAPLQYVNGSVDDIIIRIIHGILWALLTYSLALILFFIFYRYHYRVGKPTNSVAWSSMWLMIFVLWLMIWVCALLYHHYHILGTDKVGRDVFYQTIKSIRTGLLIGTLTTLFTLPFALLLGTIAGYFLGWIDDLIQYLYTTLSSIPGVLLISASVLMLQVYMAVHAQDFPTLMRRADIRLLALCFILAITGWASLCRYLRGETLKLRELEYIQAAKTLGVRHLSIIIRHIMPNVFHIVIITLVLDFSGLVLAEAVLSYVGVGVDPTTISWGNMINSSRLELARDPIVWWPLVAAFIFMFTLVLAANIFADTVRDAFDPHLRTHGVL